MGYKGNKKSNQSNESCNDYNLQSLLDVDLLHEIQKHLKQKALKQLSFVLRLFGNLTSIEIKKKIGTKWVADCLA